MNETRDPLGCPRRIGALAASLVLLLGLVALAQELPPIGEDLLGGEDELAQASSEGTYKILLVGPDGKPIRDQRHIRGIPGQISICDFPKVFLLEGKTLFATGVTLGAGPDIGAGGQVKVYNAPGKDNPELYGFVSRCSADLPPGKYRIEPFGLDFQVNGRLVAQHPALSVDAQTLKVHLVPVTFGAVEEGTGRPVPLAQLALSCRNGNLLEGIIPEQFAEMRARAFMPLIIYLPRGLAYASSLGRFEITDDGKIVPEAGARYAGGAFTATVPRARREAEPVGKGYWMLSHALRRVFRRDEEALFTVIASGEYPASDLPVLAKTEKAQHRLGTLKMPAVAGVDSRQLVVDVGALAPGAYELTVGHKDAHGFAFEVVDATRSTPLFLHCTACCNGADFTTDTEGLKVLGGAGIQSVTALGHVGILQVPKLVETSIRR